MNLLMKRQVKLKKISKQININDLIYYFKGESGSKRFINFKGPSSSGKSIRNGYTTLEITEEDEKKKLDASKTIKGRYKSEEKKVQ